MESKKLEKPRENGTFSTVQGVMKPDEEGRRVFPKQYPAWDTVRMYSGSLAVRPSFFRREQMKLTTLPAP